MTDFPTEFADGYKRYHKTDFETNRQKFQELAEKGQFPKALVIGCSDSRITPEAIFSAQPGDLFIVRNVANLVPPFDSSENESGISSAIEFAVNGLKVPNIIILGHAMCGGVKAFCSHAEDPSAVGQHIGIWIKHLKAAMPDVNFSKDVNVEGDLEEYEQAGIRQSIKNLLSYPYVKSQYESNRIKLHGAWFDFRNGNLKVLYKESNQFISMKES